MPVVANILFQLSFDFFFTKGFVCQVCGDTLKILGNLFEMRYLFRYRFYTLSVLMVSLPLQDRYVCAVTRDVLGNSVPCAVLRPS